MSNRENPRAKNHDAAVKELVFNNLNLAVYENDYDLRHLPVAEIVFDMLAHCSAVQKYTEEEIEPHVKEWKRLNTH